MTTPNLETVSTMAVTSDLNISDPIETTIVAVVHNGPFTYVSLAVKPEVLLLIRDTEITPKLRNANGSKVNIENGPDSVSYNLQFHLDPANYTVWEDSRPKPEFTKSSPSKGFKLMNEA